MEGKTVMMATARTSKKKNGRAAFATVLESLPLMVCSTNRLKPTGGETSAILTTSTRKMPNQTRAKPGLFHHRDHNGGGQHDHGDAVERSAEHDVHHGECGDQRVGAELQTVHPGRERERDAGVGHRGTH